MISIIVCSINTVLLNKFKANVAETIGVPYEMIVHDNNTTKEGLCKVYNRLAAKAKYDILCFIHEDVQFNTPNWGVKIERAMQLPDVGIIGFAGSTIKTKTLSGWGTQGKYNRFNYRQHFADGEVRNCYYNPENENYAQVVVLDGVCLIMNKDRWIENPFDEKKFDQFHLYDLDISLQMAQRYKNYVCYTVELEHFSLGSYSSAWLHYTRLFHDKWATKLPFSCYPMTHRERVDAEKQASKIILRLLMRQSILSKRELRKLLCIHYRKYPFYKLDLIKRYLLYKNPLS